MSFFRKAPLRVAANVSRTAEPAVDPFSQLYLDMPVKVNSSRGQLWLLLGAITVTAAAIGLGMMWTAKRANKKQEAAPFVYFELRAVDSMGHPIAGAGISSHDRRLGVTDSFGEWRRFMRARLGSTVAISIRKDVDGGGHLTAEKNLVVPVHVPADGEINLSASLQLSPDSEQATKAFSQPTQQKVADAVAVPIANTQAASVQTTETVKTAQDSKLLATAVTKTESAPVQRVAMIRVLSQNNTAWQDVDRARERYLANTIVPAVQHAVAAANLTAANPWVVTLQHLPVRGGNGLILVYSEGREGKANSRVAYLRNYFNNPDTTAENIVAALKYTDPQRSPNPQWQKLKVNIWGDLSSANVQVFMSGYQAQMAGTKTWEFWGPTDGENNLTIVDRDRVVYRNRVVSNSGHLNAISLPQQKVANRN